MICSILLFSASSRAFLCCSAISREAYQKRITIIELYLFSDKSANHNTSYNTKWRRAGNLTIKMADICIQFFRTLKRFSNLFQQILSLDNISNNLMGICSNSGDIPLRISQLIVFPSYFNKCLVSDNISNNLTAICSDSGDIPLRISVSSLWIAAGMFGPVRFPPLAS